MGVEVPYEWDGDWRVCQVFTSWEALATATTEKRQELEASRATLRHPTT